MGETFEEIINLIICDIFQSILDKTNKHNINTLKLVKLFANAIKCNLLDDNDINVVNIISGHLKLIFGMKEEESYSFIFNLFVEEKSYLLNFKLIDMLRKSEIKLVNL